MNCSLSAYEDFIHTPPNASLWQRAGRGTGLSGADGNRPLIHVPVSGSLRVRAHPGRREGLLGLILHRGAAELLLALLDPGPALSSSEFHPVRPLLCCTLGTAPLPSLLTLELLPPSCCHCVWNAAFASWEPSAEAHSSSNSSWSPLGRAQGQRVALDTSTGWVLLKPEMKLRWEEVGSKH